MRCLHWPLSPTRGALPSGVGRPGRLSPLAVPTAGAEGLHRGLPAAAGGDNSVWGGGVWVRRPAAADDRAGGAGHADDGE